MGWDELTLLSLKKIQHILLSKNTDIRLNFVSASIDHAYNHSLSRSLSPARSLSLSLSISRSRSLSLALSLWCIEEQSNSWIQQLVVSKDEGDSLKVNGHML